MRKIINAAALAGAGLLAAACASSTSHPAGQVGQAPINGGAMGKAPAAATGQPVNPVPVLKATGATVPASEVMGDHDIFGDRMAEGTMGTGYNQENINVYTAASSAALHQMLQRQTFQVDDFTGVIVIPANNAAVVAMAASGTGATPTPTWALGGTPAQIAKRVGASLRADGWAWRSLAGGDRRTEPASGRARREEVSTCPAVATDGARSFGPAMESAAWRSCTAGRTGSSRSGTRSASAATTPGGV
jgi:hypothetical protein